MPPGQSKDMFKKLCCKNTDGTHPYTGWKTLGLSKVSMVVSFESSPVDSVHNNASWKKGRGRLLSLV